MNPTFCPYCGERELEQIDSTELTVDNTPWIIYHYECQQCREIFDKIFINDISAQELIEIEIKPK